MSQHHMSHTVNIDIIVRCSRQENNDQKPQGHRPLVMQYTGRKIYNDSATSTRGWVIDRHCCHRMVTLTPQFNGQSNSSRVHRLEQKVQIRTAVLH